MIGGAIFDNLHWKTIVMFRSLVVLCAIAMLLTVDLSAAERPNVVVLFSDDQRADTIHALGNDLIRTPNLDRLVREGAAFTQAHIMGGLQPAVCVPSRAMMLSGKSLFRVSEKLQSETLMPQAFATAGYETFGTGKWHNGAPAYVRAFAAGDKVFLGGMSDQSKVPWRSLTQLQATPLPKPTVGDQFSSEMFTDAAVTFLKQKHDRPFFCYVAFTSPHDPRTPPGEYATMYDPAKVPLPPNFAPVHLFNNGEMQVRDELLAPWPRTPEVVRQHLADYYGMISHLDAQVGRVLKTLEETGQLKNTIIVFAGDNGLAIGSHGLFGKQNLYEHSVGVPLLIAGPGVKSGHRTAAMCYLFDVFPTLCDLAGITAPSEVEGRSLAAAAAGNKESHRNQLFFAYRDVQRGVRDRQYKLIRYPKINKSQLFDLDKDPHETTDLAYVPDQAERLTEMTRFLERSQREWGDDLPLITDPPQPFRIELKSRAK